jgi:DUF1009 family protein
VGAAPVGLIAGEGGFPLEVARGVRASGRRVVAVALRELTDPALEACVDRLVWVWLGELGPLEAALREADVTEVVLAGKVPKTFLWTHAEAVRPDARALRALEGLRDRADDSLLGAVARALEEDGFRLCEQLAAAPGLGVREGTLGAVRPGEAQLADVAFGWRVAKALGAVDVGQTVVVRDGAVLAVEAIEGTDAAIRRGCALGEPGACVVKVAKPSQDPRFDVPTVGPRTVAVLVEGRASVLAVESERTVVLERERMVREADAAGIALVAVSARSLGPGAAA